MTQAYPLQWPDGLPRTPQHKRATPKFTATIAGAAAAALAEVGRMGGSHAVVSSNLQLRRDGLPYASQAQPSDPGIAVYFMRLGKQLVFACDRWLKVEHNIRSVVLTIEALRGIERWGSSDMVDQAFTGFVALPAPPGAKGWREVLGLTGAVTPVQIDAAYRERALTAHPDKTGGSSEVMAALNRARDEARKATA